MTLIYSWKKLKFNQELVDKIKNSQKFIRNEYHLVI